MNPWDRRDDETPKQYAYFRTYLDLGDSRTLKAVSEHHEVSKTLIRNLSAKNTWVDRAAAWQDKINADAEELAGPELAAERASLHRRAAQITHAALDKAEAIINGIDTDPDAGEISAAKVSLIKAVITAYSRLAVPDESTVRMLPEPEHRGTRLEYLMAKHNQQQQ